MPRRSRNEFKVGDPLDPITDIGPMVDQHQHSRTQRWVDEAIALGGTVLAGGRAEGGTSRRPP
ncbi:MAG: aldehyde dehydrogenase family protein [Candidatus Limnocylindrales bacterium]